MAIFVANRFDGDENLMNLLSSVSRTDSFIVNGADLEYIKKMTKTFSWWIMLFWST